MVWGELDVMSFSGEKLSRERVDLAVSEAAYFSSEVLPLWCLVALPVMVWEVEVCSCEKRSGLLQRHGGGHGKRFRLFRPGLADQREPCTVTRKATDYSGLFRF